VAYVGVEDISDWVMGRIIRLFFRDQAVETLEIVFLSAGARHVEPLRLEKG
jgi:hypothetical protein